MNEMNRRVNSIIVKNLPTNCNESQLEELFSRFGRIVSSKVLPSNANFDGGCGFVNFADAESCNQAVELMNNFAIDGFSLRVSQSLSRANGSFNPMNSSDRSFSGMRPNGEFNGRSTSSLDENREVLSPTAPQRFSGFRSASERPSTGLGPSKPSSTNGLDTSSNGQKPLWNSQSEQQTTSRSPPRNEVTMDINEHELFVPNKTYSVYLSNLEVPNVIFAATLDDYLNATLLITQMNKHEQLTKAQGNANKPKLTVGQCCAAQFNGDWYRARVLEVEESRAHVKYIDWGNAGWCDSTSEIRPLPNEFYKHAALCVKCFLDGIPTEEKPSDEQTNGILEVLVLDVKLEMTITRLDNGLPFVLLNLGERNLNAEICALFPPAPTPAPAPVALPSNERIRRFDDNKPVVNRTDIHNVQLTTVDAEPDCFHVLLMRDCLPTIMNVMKDWNASKQPMKGPPKANMLVCAQYDGDDLWYRAWVQSVNDTGCRVYFVDFGNEEAVTMNRLSECPDNLQTIPWQSVQIKLARIQLTDDERYSILRDFESDRLEMKVLGESQDVYSVDLIHNGKSLTEHMLELRQKKTPAPVVVEEIPQEPPAFVQPAPAKVPITTTAPIKTESLPRTFKEFVPRAKSPAPPLAPIVKEPNPNQFSPRPLPAVTPTPASTTPPSNGRINEDNLADLITEQRRQNRLMEQVVAAINTTNALLAQLVQHSSTA